MKEKGFFLVPLLIAIFVGLLVIGGFLIYRYWFQPNWQDSPLYDLTKCKNIDDPSKKRDKDRCYEDAAVVNRNFNICEKVEFISERIQCYYAVVNF